MKNVLKIFILIAVLFAAVTETADAQTRRARSSNTNGNGNISETIGDKVPPSLPPGQILEEYFDHLNEHYTKCVYVNIATNEVFRGKKFPNSTWSITRVKIDNNSLKSIDPSKRFWNSRRYKREPLLYQPFDAKKADDIELVLTKDGDNVKGRLIKNGVLPGFEINILGAMTKHQGHVLYGSYGTHGGFITLSLIKSEIPQ